MGQKKHITHSLILFIYFGFSVLLGSPEKYHQEQEKQEIPKPAYEVEVVVTNVNVIVTDKDGKRITDLKPENFEIYENGRLQKLSNFYEVKGMEVYAPLPEKKEEVHPPPAQPLPVKSSQFTNKIIFYFDNWQLHPMSRNWSIERLEKFIKNNFEIRDGHNEGMIICLSQKLEVIQGFTTNQWRLLDALKEVKKRSGQSLLQARAREDMQQELNRMISNTSLSDNKYESFQRAMSLAKNFVEDEQNNLIYSLKSLNAVIENLRGVDGKKILIYVSEGLPLNPGEVVYDYIDSAFAIGNARMEAMNYDATRIFKEFTARCNASEITLYPINARGLDSTILSADKGEGWNVYKRGSGMVKATSRVRNAGLELMANETGGVPIVDTNDIASGLSEITGDLQYYYSLGYVSPHREEGKYLPIEVKLVGVEKKYDVRVRHGYVRVSLEDRIRESVSSRLYLPRLDNPLNVMVQMLPIKKKAHSSRRSLNIKFLIPIKNLTLYSEGDFYVGKIKAYIALKDSKNHISPCHELVEDIKIPTSDYEVALKSSYPYIAEMYVEPGQYIISMCIRDLVGDALNYFQLQWDID
jgi:VWFA-related protein